MIARLPNVQLLNGTAVESLERMDAERAFLRHFYNHSPAPRRFAELEAKYGRVAPLAQVDLGAPVFVAVTLTSPSFSKRPYKINVRQSVGQLKKSLTPITGLSPSKCRVFYADAVMINAGGLEELRYPGRALHSYAIAEGDEIIVQEKWNCSVSFLRQCTKRFCWFSLLLFLEWLNFSVHKFEVFFFDSALCASVGSTYLSYRYWDL